jgi:hypothetical protein
MNSLDLRMRTPPRAPVDAALRFLRYFGLIGFLGGLAALSAMWAFGPVPQTLDQWHMMIAHVKAIFFACSFSGIVLLVIVGSISWWRMRRTLHASRWFRVMMGMLLITIPASHISARWMAEKMYEKIDAGQLEQAADLWRRLGWAYVLSLTALLAIAAIGIAKPRLGQSIDDPAAAP